mgnify:CR=1 FL=1
MHDGSVNTLEEAIERELYYVNSTRETPLALTAEEKAALLFFLRTLSDLGFPVGTGTSSDVSNACSNSRQSKH